MAPPKKRAPRPSSALFIPSAPSVVAAAASLATAKIASDADQATQKISTAAAVALQVVETATARAIAEFPNLQADIRDLRGRIDQVSAAQVTQTETLISVVTGLLKGHTDAEAGRLRSIDESVARFGQGGADRNTRLGTLDTSVARLNLVVFAIGGPLATAATLYLVHAAWVRVFAG